MIKEAYCSFEVSKLLKEKGFDEIFHTFYHTDDEKICVHLSCRSYKYGDKLLDDEVVAAPTHQMALAWLREVHKIQFTISPFVASAMNEDCCDTYYIQFYNYCTDIHKYKGWHNLSVLTKEEYPSYEEAVEAALLYTLQNLI